MGVMHRIRASDVITFKPRSKRVLPRAHPLSHIVKRKVYVLLSVAHQSFAQHIVSVYFYCF